MDACSEALERLQTMAPPLKAQPMTRESESMKKRFGQRSMRLSAVAVATAGLVVLAGCSGSGGDGDAGGSAGEGPLHAGLPWGSSAEEFAAAVADMEPVHLTVQSSAPSEASARAWSWRPMRLVH